jgi:arylsulfatase
LDLFPTLANITGGTVPNDWEIDGVDQTDFFLGKQKRSNRDGFIVYVGNDIFGVKWRNWKMMFKEVERGPTRKRPGTFLVSLICTMTRKKNSR